MTKGQGVEILKNLYFVVQKMRSNVSEIVGKEFGADDMDKYNVQMFPWLFGEKSIFIGLMKAVEIYEATEHFEPNTLRNFIIISQRFDEAIADMYHLKIGSRLPAYKDIPVLDWD